MNDVMTHSVRWSCGNDKPRQVKVDKPRQFLVKCFLGSNRPRQPLRDWREELKSGEFVRNGQ